MATERLRMRDVREILRQKLVLKRSNRQVGASLRVSHGAVSGAVGRARTLGLDWEKIATLTDDALEERLYGPRSTKCAGRPLPDPAYLHVELRRPGVTLQLLHLEYLVPRATPDRFSIHDLLRALQRVAREAGHDDASGAPRRRKALVDYSGKKPHIVDPETGAVIEVELFVAALDRR